MAPFFFYLFYHFIFLCSSVPFLSFLPTLIFTLPSHTLLFTPLPFTPQSFYVFPFFVTNIFCTYPFSTHSFLPSFPSFLSFHLSSFIFLVPFLAHILSLPPFFFSRPLPCLFTPPRLPAPSFLSKLSVLLPQSSLPL